MRRWARLVALVLLVASARLPHAGQDDQACAPLFSDRASRDAGALVESSGQTSPTDHCAICHWTRLLRSPLTVVGVTIASDGPATQISRQLPPVHVDPVTEHLPARAPPATLL
jgi:hypothetical protein